MSKGSITESANTEMCCKAKKIADISSYIILPSRIVYPERYIHPNNSLEAKKALLMSMSPMLADAGMKFVYLIFFLLAQLIIQ